MGNIHATTHRIYLIIDARAFKYATYLVGPKERKLESFEIKHQLFSGVFKHSNAEWAAPVLRGPVNRRRIVEIHD